MLNARHEITEEFVIVFLIILEIHTEFLAHLVRTYFSILKTRKLKDNTFVILSNVAYDIHSMIENGMQHSVIP